MIGKQKLPLVFALFFFPPAFALGQQSSPPRLPVAKPAEVGMNPAKLAGIDQFIEEAIRRRDIPGAVVVIVRQGKIVFRKAYGHRALQPMKLVMELDTLFDMASLTKPIATATSIMLLLEKGKLRLSDPVDRYLPGFDEGRKKKITIEQLLLHTSGLIADNSIKDYQEGKAKAISRLLAQKPTTEPGSVFRYSDVGYLLLGMIVEKVSGKTLDTFSKENIFAPLGLKDTTFLPPAELAKRSAITQERNGTWMRGEVHDPRAYLLGGVAGHAGLFSTADDVAVYAQMILQGGAFGGRRILSPATVNLMTELKPVPHGKRTLGWDADTSYSSNRGELFPVGGFGHTGFTGTSLWVDPGSRIAVIILTNRVHPDDKGAVIRLRNQVATTVAASIEKAPFPAPMASSKSNRKIASVLCGIDVLKKENYKSLRGHRLGLVTNHTGLDRQGNSTIDLLHQAPEVKLVALFSPEHGIRGQLDEKVGDSRDVKTGLPIYSLYGKRKKPSAEQLRDVDVLVFDIQDIGCRFYTYISTLGYLLETAAQHHKKVIVLDRPNPIGGLAVEGPVLEKSLESFVGYHPLPVRHGMTIGELALLFNAERKINADLTIVRMEGWRRNYYWNQTDLLWVNPSPNMRSLEEALLYPGIGLLETTNVSVGRGTDRPFEIVGAPWLDGQRFVKGMERYNLSGIRLVATKFIPTSSTHAGKNCGGVHLFIEDWERFSPLSVGLAMALELKRQFPKDWKSQGYLRLLGHPPTLEAIERGDGIEEIERLWVNGLGTFHGIREKYLLYP